MEIKIGDTVKTVAENYVATVVDIKGRWVKIRFGNGAEKNVGRKDIAPVERRMPKNGVVDPCARARYVKVKTEDGAVRIDNGDAVATALRARNLEEIYEIAATVLGTTVDALKGAYRHLNPGMQRMNLGNRIRKAVREDPELFNLIK